MPIEFRCSGCQKLLRVPDESAGKKARCPECGAIVDVPAAGSAPASAPASAPFVDNPFSDPGQRASTFGMDSNPYAAPRPEESAPVGAAPAGTLNHQAVSLNDLLNTSWAIFKPQWPMGLALMLVMIALGAAVGIITTPLNMAAQASREVSLVIAAQVLGQIVSFFAQAWIQLGAAAVGLRWSRTGNIDISLLFSVGQKYWRGLGAHFIVQIIILGIYLVCFVPFFVTLPQRSDELSVITAVVGALVAIPLVAWIALKYALAAMFIADRNAGVTEALKESSRYMAGNKGTLFFGWLVIGVVAMLIACPTCFVGLLAVGSYATVFGTVMYLRATGQAVWQPPPDVKM